MKKPGGGSKRLRAVETGRVNVSSAYHFLRSEFGHVQGGRDMKRAWIIAVSVVALGVMPSLERAQNRAGFQVGDTTPAFDVVDVTGPNKGKKLCYV